jgi:hypothetical protein
MWQSTHSLIPGNAELVLTPMMICYTFLDAIPEQVANMWLRFDLEFASWGTEDHIHNIRNSTDKEHTRLPLYKEDLVKLKHGEWLGNSIIDFLPECSTSLEPKTHASAWTVGSCTTCT